MATVIRKPDESFDSLLKRFKKKTMKEGTLKELKDRRYFVSKSEQRRLLKKQAERKLKRKV